MTKIQYPLTLFVRDLNKQRLEDDSRNLDLTLSYCVSCGISRKRHGKGMVMSLFGNGRRPDSFNWQRPILKQIIL